MPASRPGPAAAVGPLLTPCQPPTCQPPTQPRGPVNEEGQIAAPFQSGLSPHCPPSPRTPHLPTARSDRAACYPGVTQTPLPTSSRKRPRPVRSRPAVAGQPHGKPSSLHGPKRGAAPKTWALPRDTCGRLLSPSTASLWPGYAVGTRLTSPLPGTQATARRIADASRTRAHTRTRTHTRTRRLAGWSEQSRRRSPGRRVLQEHRRHDGSRSLDGQTRDV